MSPTARDTPNPIATAQQLPRAPPTTIDPSCQSRCPRAMGIPRTGHLLAREDVQLRRFRHAPASARYQRLRRESYGPGYLRLVGRDVGSFPGPMTEMMHYSSSTSPLESPPTNLTIDINGRGQRQARQRRQAAPQSQRAADQRLSTGALPPPHAVVDSDGPRSAEPRATPPSRPR